jgi:hypothetical protein
VVKAVVDGFFKGLRLQAAHAFIPGELVHAFKQFLHRLPPDDIHDLLGMIADRMNPETPERALVKSHLENHIAAVISNFHEL